MKYFSIARVRSWINRSIFSGFFNWLIKVRRSLINLMRKRRLKKFTKPTFIHLQYGGKSFELLVDPQNGRLDETLFIKRKIYEPTIHKLMCNELKKGDTFVDIGSNIGIYTGFIPQVVGQEGKIIAFEPIKRLYQQNLKSIERNKYKNVILYNDACSDRVGTNKIYLTAFSLGSSAISPSELQRERYAIDEEYFETITTVIGDDILLKEAHIDFIKIDVEGHEYAVLLGIQKTLEKFRPKMILEFSPLFTPETTEKIIELLEPLYTHTFIIEDRIRCRNTKEDIGRYINLKSDEQRNLFFYNL